MKLEAENEGCLSSKNIPDVLVNKTIKDINRLTSF